MKKILSFIILSAAVLLSAAEKVIAFWDFTKNSLVSEDGKTTLVLRGKTKLDKGLRPGSTLKDVQEGAIVKPRVNLDPNGAFRIEAEFVLTGSDRKNPQHFIFDSKYISYAHKKPEYNRGIFLLLTRYDKANAYVPTLGLGFGKTSEFVNGPALKLELNKVYTLSASWDTFGTVCFRLNGKLIDEKVIKRLGATAPAYYNTVIGDRVMGTHQGFDGIIRKVKLIQCDPPAEAKQKAALRGALPIEKEFVAFQWDFTKGKLTSSDGRYTWKLRGKTAVVPNPDGGMMVKVGSTLKDVPEGMVMDRIYPELSPAEGFQLEAKIQFAKEPDKKRPTMVIFDTKYYYQTSGSVRQNSGIMYSISMSDPMTGFSPILRLGFGKKSVQLRGKYCSIGLGSTHTVGFRFNGTNKVTFLLDGKPTNVVNFTTIGPLSPAQHPAALGDRVGGIHSGLYGSLLGLQIRYFPKGGDAPDITAGRLAFTRDEKGVPLRFFIRNDSRSPFTKVKGRFNLGGKEYTFDVPDMAVGTEKTVSVPVDHRLAVGKYPFTVRMDYTAAGKARKITENFVYLASPRRFEQMPVNMWGCSNWKESLEIGFNHTMIYGIMETTPDGRLSDQSYRLLDEVLFSGHTLARSFGIGHMGKRFPRTSIDGKKIPGNPEASHPELQAEVKKRAEVNAKATAEHPAFGAILFNSEVRDRSFPSWGTVEPAAFKKFAGYPIPEKVKGKNGPNWKTVKGFPADRLVDPKDPLMVYYGWFYRQGDGWNDLQSLLSETYHKYNKRKEFFTWYDPSVRVPPLWGSGGTVDYLNHWTYCYPDPLNIGTNTVEQEAMAEGRDGQDIMSMIQVICYRNRTAPINKKVKDVPAWFKGNETCGFLTLPPDMMREAIWIQLSRATKGIMFHGWGSVTIDPASLHRNYYRYTNPETKKVMGTMFRQVVGPFGPFLRQVKEHDPEVAILESFASFVYAGRGSYGWNGDWTSCLNLMLQWANMQPRVLYEETIMKGGLDKVKVLILAHCDVLPKPVYQKILEFQRKGGIVVADEFTVPGILPDFNVTSYPGRPGDKPKESKAFLQKKGLAFRKMLAGDYTPKAGSSDPDLITWVRNAEGGSDLLFVVNDKRTFGNYIGQFGYVMEKGLPLAGKVTMNRSAAAVYDLMNHKETVFTKEKAGISLPVSFPSTGGAMYLVTQVKVGKVALALSKTEAKPGDSVTVSCMVTGADGKLFPSLLPAEVIVTSPDGKRSDDSHAFCIRKGKAEVNVAIPLNSPKGNYTVSVRDLASGKSASGTIRVR